MFERYTERARRVLFFARYESSQLGSLRIEADHLLLGLLREGKGLTIRILSERNISPDEIREAILQRATVSTKFPTSIEIPFSAEAKRVLERAAREADDLLHSYIGTEHLLLALLAEEKSLPAVILNERGLTLDAARQQVVELTKGRRGDRDGAEPSHKPSGYSTVSPYLVAEGAQRVIDFLKQTFDATEERRYDNDDGTIMHAEVRIDDTIVMLGDAGEGWPAIPMWMHVYVPDVDATYRRALAAGGTSVQEPTRKAGDPDRRGGVKDPAGNTWWIATQVEDA